ncbi:MAG: hypothetical protein WBD20_02805 [Pirellulaceae bacterium]
MVDPYEPIESVPGSERRAVKRYVALAVLVAIIAGVVSLPGLDLLSQSEGADHIEWRVSGEKVSNESVVRYAIGTAFLLAIIALALSVKGGVNWRWNRKLVSVDLQRRWVKRLFVSAGLLSVIAYFPFIELNNMRNIESLVGSSVFGFQIRVLSFITVVSVLVALTLAVKGVWNWRRN